VSRAGLLCEVSETVAPARPTRGEVRIGDLVARHFDFVWRLLRRLGLSETDADDAAQQVFIVAALRWQRIEPGKERTFLYGVALRTVANVRRTARRRRETGEELLDELPATAARPDELAEAARTRALLDELLGALPDELRRVLVLAELDEATMPEIAELEGIPVGTATSRVRRARTAFRELFAAQRHRIGSDQR
jgi:RNA polymerase sigma-70 factor (ECF subfamily)